MEEFIDKILTTLKSNGFPDKKVSLPTEKMYEAADNRDLSFNKVIEQMKEQNELDVEITDDKIIFSKVDQTVADSSENPFGNMDQAEIMKKAQEMLSKMDPEEVKRMQDMFSNMSEEEKEEMMKKGKDLGLV